MEDRIQTLEGQIDSLTSAVEMLSDTLAMKVDKNEIIEAINLSDEEIRIKGDRFQIDKNTLVDSNVRRHNANN